MGIDDTAYEVGTPRETLPPIPDALRRLDGEIAHLDGAVAAVIQKLDGILTPEGPEKMAEGRLAEVAPDRSEHATALAARADHVGRLAFRLEAALARIEV